MMYNPTTIANTLAIYNFERHHLTVNTQKIANGFAWFSNVESQLTFSDYACPVWTQLTLDGIKRVSYNAVATDKVILDILLLVLFQPQTIK